MRKFWGRGADSTEPNAKPESQPVRAALLREIARQEGRAEIRPQDVGPWRRDDTDPGTHDETVPEHPAGYIAAIDDSTDPEAQALVHAVNAALVLGKPLLLTGSPGTGKSQLAERVAWEFNRSPVQRFEAKSLSEADDLFCRFDVVGRLAGVEAFKAAEVLKEKPDRDAASAGRHLHFGALGLAILRSNPSQAAALRAAGWSDAALGPDASARGSVVLIDEIDKTSRDFPNDLLNQIDRKEFKVRELGDLLLRASPDEALRPIVIITSNSERELPPPFLRRCVYFHIPDPTPEMLARILRSRVPGVGDDKGGMKPLYQDMLDFFLQYQKEGLAVGAYRVGTSELQDLARALQAPPGVDEAGRLSARDNAAALRRASATLIKHPSDGDRLKKTLGQWKAG